MSKRTNPAAIYELKKELPDHDIIPIHLPPHILHLDCVMNILSHDEMLIYPGSVQKRGSSLAQHALSSH
ncbi:arginine deiminase family protein [Bacillus sp. SL00103]